MSEAIVRFVEWLARQFGFYPKEEIDAMGLVCYQLGVKEEDIFKMVRHWHGSEFRLEYTRFQMHRYIDSQFDNLVSKASDE